MVEFAPVTPRLLLFRMVGGTVTAARARRVAIVGHMLLALLYSAVLPVQAWYIYNYCIPRYSATGTPLRVGVLVAEACNEMLPPPDIGVVAVIFVIYDVFVVLSPVFAVCCGIVCVRLWRGRKALRMSQDCVIPALGVLILVAAIGWGIVAKAVINGPEYVGEVQIWIHVMAGTVAVLLVTLLWDLIIAVRWLGCRADNAA